MGLVNDFLGWFFGLLGINLSKDSGTITNANLRAILKVIRTTEGTEKMLNPYAVTFGYSHTIKDFSDHPRNTGEWNGKKLSDAHCRGAGYSVGCVSTASGAYQFIVTTWNALKIQYGLSSFSKENQDKAAVYLIKQRGAYDDVIQGRIELALKKLSKEWASLPFSTVGQPTVNLKKVLSDYKKFGGTLN